MSIDGFGRVALRGHSTASFCPISRLSRHRALLLLGVAGASLSGAIGVSAGDVNWVNTNSAGILWEDGANWNSGAAPLPGDTVTIGSGGTADLYSHTTVDTVNLESGTLWINRNAKLNVGTVNVSGGMLGLVVGNPNAPKNPGPQGVINISTLLNITGGTVERPGLIEVGDAGTVTQSGGSVLGSAQIHTPSYVQTGGVMGGQVTASTYDISGAEGEPASEMAGAVYVDSQFTMADGALVTGWVAGDGSAAMLQTGGAMEGSVSGLSSYTQTGGMLAGTTVFSDRFELSGSGEVGWVDIIGSTDAEFNQSGGIMGGIVYAPVGSEDMTHIAKYSQTGGDMTGWVTTRIYEVSGGTVASTVDFSDLFALSGDASIGDVYLNGDGDAAMTQSGGTMGAWVTGVDTYSQSGGDMTAWVTADTYEASGGNVSGKVDFSELFALSGDAVVNAGSSLNGDGDAAMTQTGGTMAGEVGGISTYTMSGGTLAGVVNFTDDFQFSGGDIGFVDVFGSSDATMTQSGGTMMGWVHTADGDGFIEKYTQTGGEMGLYVTTRNYEMSGGTINDWVDVSELFELKDGVVTSRGGLAGWGSASVVQSGGTMGGEAIDIVGYDQSGGAMTGFVATDSYDLSGGSVSGQVNFASQFTLSDDGEVVAGATLSSSGAGQMAQSGGTMSGHANGITTYTQSGGAMDGRVDTVDYAQSGGTLSGDVNFGTQFALSGTGSVTSDGKLIGDGSATATQSGGAMDGTVTGVTSYAQSGGSMGGTTNTNSYALSGGTLSGDVNFGTQFALSGTGSVTSDGNLIGDGSATATQSGGAMDGTVTGVTSYAQSGGSMGGTTNANTYALSGGTLSGDVNFGTQFALSGTGSVSSDGNLTGDGSATATQSGGAMGGTVTGVTSYTQSAGTMTGAVTAPSYALSGGTLSGQADFSTQFALSGTGTVTSAGQLVGTAPGATVTQAAGTTMAGTVSGTVASYTQSGGTMSGNVIATEYKMSGGTLSGDAAFSSFLLSGDQNVVVSGHLIGEDGSVVTQVGGQMNGHVSGVTDYLQGGRVGPTAVIEFERLYALSNGFQLDAGAKVLGEVGSVMTQSSGKMEGSVSGIASYTQSGGKMTGSVSTGSYVVTADEVKGAVTFTDSFALSGSGLVTGSGVLTGGAGSTMLQTGGGMRGTVSGIESYAQSGGDMGYTSAGVTRGSVSTANYSLSGGNLAGQVGFSTLFALSETGLVTATAQLLGGSGSTMTQAGGTMDGTVSGVIGYDQSGGVMSGSVTAANYTLTAGTLSGDATVGTLFALSGTGLVTAVATLSGGGDAAMTQSGGTMHGIATGFETYAQSGGTMDGKVTSQSYTLSGGSFAGQADFAALFDLIGGSVGPAGQLVGGAGSVMTQSGGTMDGTVVGIDRYTQTAGTMTGSVTATAYDHAGGSVDGNFDVATYSLTGTGTSAGTINASSAFNLGFDGDVATVNARLSGAGDVVKSGTSTVVLANSANDFTGDVVVNGGVLQVQDAALPGEATVEMANGATLRFNTGVGANVQFDGNMTGDTGILEKSGTGILTLGGNIHLGALQVSGGLLNIGNGAPEEASFDSAYIAAGAKLYVASGATLRVRIPKNIANFGTLTNDGTVYDDLDNAGMFVNNAVYVANVASNTRDIANNSPGVWTGDILTNNGWINNNENATWNGNVVTNDVRVANAGGIWRGNVVANNGHIINDNRSDEIGTGYWIGDVVSNNNWIFNGGGGDWTGDVRSNANLVMNDGLATWNGDILSNSWLVWNGGDWNGKVVANANTIHNAGGIWTGDVQANTGSIVNIAGIRLDLPTADSTWIGNVASNGGTITNGPGSTWTGNVLGNSGTISTLGLWTGNFNNAGTVWAQNQIVGAFSNSGVLQVTGNLGGITALSNIGTIDMTTAGAQQLSADSANFASGSFLDMQIDPNGTSDRIVITGAATLGGTVRIRDGGEPHTNGAFTILTAGSLVGTFDAVTTDMAFFTPHLSYDMQSVSVGIQRNGVGFNQVGATDNQMAVGTAVEALGAGNPIYDAVLRLTQAEAQSAFDQLSGEPHASQTSAAMQTSSGTGQIATNRVAQAFAALEEGAGQVSSYAETSFSTADGMSNSGAVWGELYGARGVVDAGSGTAGVASSNGGIVAGLDGLLGDWRLGLLLQGGLSGTQVAALNATSSSTDYGLGLYGGREFGDTLLSFGATYTRHDNSTTRQVSFPGFTDTLNASYGSGTSQVFGNVSHEFDFGAVSLKPYAGLAYVSHATEAFTESGGAAALSSAANVVSATFASFGLGAEHQFVVGEDMLLTATGSLGWRHAFTEAAISVHQFGGGPALTVTGNPAASDTLTVGAGLALDVGGGTNLNLTYSGQIGNGTQTHGLQGVWAQRF